VSQILPMGLSLRESGGGFYVIAIWKLMKEEKKDRIAKGELGIYAFAAALLPTATTSPKLATN
jgi:hypothetical protein